MRVRLYLTVTRRTMQKPTHKQQALRSQVNVNAAFSYLSELLQYWGPCTKGHLCLLQVTQQKASCEQWK